MTSTDLIVVEPGGYLALNHDLDEVKGFIEDNLAGQDVNEFDLVRLSVPSGKATKYRWEIPTLDGSETADEISGIIVFQKQTRGFWPKSIDEGGGGIPPSCASEDGVTGFGKQWATAENVDPDGDARQVACATCPHAQFGSDGGRGQACKQSAQLFLLMENGFLPAVVSVPPTSLAAVKKYMLALANAGIRYRDVVTTFALDKKQNAGGTDYAQIAPRLGGRLESAEADKARAYGELLKGTFQRVVTFPVAPDGQPATAPAPAATPSDEPAAAAA